MTELHEAALRWAQAGFCVLPTNHNAKTPMVTTWKQYVKAKGSNVVPAPPAVAMVDRWFSEHQTGLGLILGATSGNAEMLEFEGRAIPEGVYGNFGAFCDTNGAGEIWARLKAGYVEVTPSGGLHFVFRVTGGPALGNTRLAARPSDSVELAANPQQPIQVLIETRGEGGFVVIAPSGMSDGRQWRQTGHGAVCELTVTERDLLYSVARMFDTVPEYVRKETVKREAVEGRISPLDDFRARTDWADILEPQGWKHVGLKSDGRDAWLRPGKDFGEGWGLSATTGNTDGKSDSLYVFSTSAGLPTETSMTKEFVWAHYNTGGDFSEATRALAEQGYGDGMDSRIIPGCLDAFSDGFDPKAWTADRLAKTAAQSAHGPVPTVSAREDLVEGEFQALDWKTLFEEKYVEEWVVEGFLPARRAMALYSKPKLGKSLLMLEMAAHVSRGTEFMGRPTTQCTVLYFDHENDPRGDIAPRLRAMGFDWQDLSNLKVLSFPNMATLDTEAGGLAMMRAVAQYDAGLVIIDTVSRTIKGEENSNDTWLQLYAHTGKLLKAAEIPYVRLDHSGKDENKGQRGGSAKSGDVDAIWQLTGGGRVFELKLDGGRMTFPNETIGFTREHAPHLKSVGQNSVVAARGDGGQFEAKVGVAADVYNAVMRYYLVPGGKMNKTQLRDLCGVRMESVQPVLDGMVRTDFLRTQKSGNATEYVTGGRFPKDWVDPSPPVDNPVDN